MSSVQVAGVKMIIRNPNHVPSLSGSLMLFDSESDDFLAVMDATYITAWRTGSMGAIATHLLAKTNYSSVGLVGLGNVGRPIFFAYWLFRNLNV